MDTSFSLWSAWDSVINPQESIKNSLHNDIVKLQDFLVCEVQSIVGAAQSAIEQDMSQVRGQGVDGPGWHRIRWHMMIWNGMS
jgi:hypothetical protein